MNLRISATWLESFRLICQTTYGKEAELVANILRKPFKLTLPMRVGTAWHKVLEGFSIISIEKNEQRDWLCEANGISFSVPYGMLSEIDSEGCKEIKGYWKTLACGHDCNIVGKLDNIQGNLVTDHKTKLTPWKMDSYEDSLQWRIYLLAFRVPRFRYKIWEFSSPDKEGDTFILGDVSQFGFYEYGNMHWDVMEWVDKFIWWAEKKKLLEYMDQH
jgi:hypothetical protein